MTSELGKALIGFKHDEPLDPAIRFEVLRLRSDSRFRVQSRAVRQKKPQMKPWWKFW